MTIKDLKNLKDLKVFKFLKAPWFVNHKKLAISLGAVLLLAIVISVGMSFKKDTKTVANATQTTTVSKGSLTVEITGSGTIEANEQYDITSVVNGDVLEDYFEEGDVLAEGDIMYKIDSESAQNSITRAQSSLEKAQMNYDSAKESYDGLTVKTPISGTVTSVSAKKGAKANNGATLFTVSNNSQMILKIYFNEADRYALYEGSYGSVYLDKTGEELSGTVTRVSTGSISVGGVDVCQVTLLVDNTGAIKEGDTATAIINNVACNTNGTFEISEEKTISAEASGDITAVNVVVGDKVSAGDVLATIKSTQATSSLKNAQLSYNDAVSSLSDAYDNLDKYTITAPISGTVLNKTVKKGDTISGGQSGSTSMAIIADMSKMKFTISVDELDISKMEVGQKVTVTADALENQRFTGYIDNVSVVGTTQSGVTTYPITVIIEEYGDLIPGMNVDASIVVAEAIDVLTVPISAVQRGNIVYVKDSDLTQDQKNSLSFDKARPGEMGAKHEMDDESKEPDIKAPSDLPDNKMVSGDRKMTSDANKNQGAKIPHMQAPDNKGTSDNKTNAENVQNNKTARTIKSPYEGYTAVRVTVGLSNNDYAEITSGLYEGQEIIYIETKASENTGFFPMGAMGGMRGTMGGMPGGMGGRTGGAMPGGGMGR